MFVLRHLHYHHRHHDGQMPISSFDVLQSRRLWYLARQQHTHTLTRSLPFSLLHHVSLKLHNDRRPRPVYTLPCLLSFFLSLPSSLPSSCHHIQTQTSRDFLILKRFQLCSLRFGTNLKLKFCELNVCELCLSNRFSGKSCKHTLTHIHTYMHSWAQVWLKIASLIDQVQV